MHLEEVTYLRAIVPVMRELGVEQAFGVILGPVPTKAQVLQTKVEAEPQNEKLSEALKEELRDAKIRAAREEMRLTLAATGRQYSDQEIDSMMGPVD